MIEGKRVLTQEEKDEFFAGKLGVPVPPKQEQPTEEKPVETEKVVDTEKTEKPVETEFDYSVFKNKFEREISDEESLRALFEKSDKYEELDSTLKETKQTLEEYKTLASKVNPLSHFANEDEYKRQQLLIKYKDTLGTDAIKELSVLNPEGIKSLNDVSALKLQLMVDDGLTERQAELYLTKKYGVDDFEDIEDDVAVNLKVDANKARKEVSKLYDGIEIPSAPDIEAARTELRGALEKEVPTLIKSIDKIELSDGLDFVVTDDMKKEVEETVKEWAMVNGISPSKEANERIVEMAKDLVFIGNKEKIVKSIKADLEEQIKADVREKVHNDKPLKEDTRTSDQKLSNDAKVRKVLK